MRLVRFGLAVALAAILAGSASAQEQKKRPGGGRGGFGGFGSDPLGLVTQQKSVQEELKVTEDQLKKLEEAQNKLREGFRPGGGGGGGNFDAEEFRKRMEERRKNVDKALADALKPEQKKRLEQIVLQQTVKNQGMAAALRDTTVTDALKLSADQKELLTAIGEDQRKLMTELRPTGGGGGGFGRLSEEAQKKLADFRKSADGKITKSFSDEQNKTWKDLVGAEFTGTIEQRRRPGGGGQ